MKKHGGHLLVLFLTAALTARGSLTDTNFSAIGSRGVGRMLFLLWGALVSIGSYLSMEELMDRGQARDACTEALLILAKLCFLCGLGLPYRPGLVPEMARLHVGFSLAGCLLFLVCSFRFLRVLQHRYGRLFGPEQWFLRSVMLFSGVLYRAVGMISGLLEVFVTLALLLYLKILEKKLEKIRLAKCKECDILNRLK